MIGLAAVKSLIDYFFQINNISWQIVFLICILTFRKEIIHLIVHIKELFVGGAKATFRDPASGETEQDKQESTESIISKKEVERLLKSYDSQSNSLATAKIELLFEKAYRLLFSSQLKLLTHCFLVKDFSISAKEAFMIYSTSIHSKSYPYSNWVGFIVDQQLIIPDNTNSRYTLTNLGNQFMTYYLHNRLSIYKSGSDIPYPNPVINP